LEIVWTTDGVTGKYLDLAGINKLNALVSYLGTL